ncbi:MAG TPA: hypothetical protein VFV38_46180 [Ktedonobacteraceae bacterium]|nr:hypothetical protein [Ktedonobacteraceae bacterium]
MHEPPISRVSCTRDAPKASGMLVNGVEKDTHPGGRISDHSVITPMIFGEEQSYPDQGFGERSTNDGTPEEVWQTR